jgi:hypothetical protein
MLLQQGCVLDKKSNTNVMKVDKPTDALRARSFSGFDIGRAGLTSMLFTLSSLSSSVDRAGEPPLILAPKVKIEPRLIRFASFWARLWGIGDSPTPPDMPSNGM